MHPETMRIERQGEALRALVERSKIVGDYEVTNVWRINPAYSRLHPAVFPLELAEKVISYWISAAVST